jgi:hypothetical protein
MQKVHSTFVEWVASLVQVFHTCQKKEIVQPFFYQGALTPLIRHYYYGQGRHGDGIIHGFLTSPLLTRVMLTFFKEHGSCSRKKID